MNHCDSPTVKETTAALIFDLGTFEGFNFRHQCAIERILTADEVVAWDHDRKGEAEFWPSGDHAGVRVIFAGQSAVTASELIALDQLLNELGGDTDDAFLRVYHALSHYGTHITALTVQQVEDDSPHIFIGSNFTDLRQEAAYELFELYYPEAYAVWEKSTCDGLIFDTDRFLDSPSWSVLEVNMDDRKALVIAPQ
jgi:hypothetical protein